MIRLAWRLAGRRGALPTWSALFIAGVTLIALEARRDARLRDALARARRDGWRKTTEQAGAAAHQVRGALPAFLARGQAA